MIDKRKFLLFNRATLVIILGLLLLLLLRHSFASFESSGEGSAKASVAFFAISAGTQSKSLKLSDVKPDGNDNFYYIDVSNFKDNKVSEVDLDYSLSIRTTTNIPVNYSLFLNDSTENIIGNKEVITDKDGMYFFKFSIPASSFSKGVKKTDTYKLVINFPSEYNDDMYQSMIDNVEISLNAKQV